MTPVQQAPSTVQTVLSTGTPDTRDFGVGGWSAVSAPQTPLFIANNNSLTLALLLTTIVLIGVITLPATPYGGDPVAWQAEARSILARGELNVPASFATNFGEPGQFFVLNHKNGKYYSKYGTLNGILNVFPLLAGQIIGNDVIALGVFAVLLSGIIAYVLYDVTGYYAKAEWVRVAFVLLCFYTTYAWYYLRGTNSEPTQWLFFLLAFRALLKLNRTGAKHQARMIIDLWLWTACLCLTKISWVLFMPLVAGALIYLAYRKRIPRSLWPGLTLRTIVLPVALICAIIAINNWVKFGAPWLSGYHQWRDPDPKVDFIAAFYDLGWSAQWSLFISFPLLFIALPFWKRFWHEHKKEEAIFVLAVFVLYLNANILRGVWRGDWCYGPRYFLFILPLLALPAIYALEWIAQHIRRPAGYLALAAVLAAGVWLVGVQWQVNRLYWFFKYEVEGDLTPLKDSQVHKYFEHTHFAKINWDYWRARNDLTKIPYYNQIRTGLSQDQMEYFLSDVQNLLSRPNLYWWCAECRHEARLNGL